MARHDMWGEHAYRLADRNEVFADAAAPDVLGDPVVREFLVRAREVGVHHVGMADVEADADGRRA